MADSAFYDQAITRATFLFEVDGQEIGQFEEVTGLEVEVAVENVEEGGENGFVHHLPGRMSWPNITLKRGVTQSDNLFAWLNKSSGEQFTSSGNKLTRLSAAITLISGEGKRLRAWEFVDAFPVKWRGPEFATSAADPASETLEITHHGFKAKSF